MGHHRIIRFQQPFQERKLDNLVTAGGWEYIDIDAESSSWTVKIVHTFIIQISINDNLDSVMSKLVKYTTEMPR